MKLRSKVMVLRMPCSVVMTKRATRRNRLLTRLWYVHSAFPSEALLKTVQAATQHAVDSAKSTGSSWFGWGSAKAEDTKEQAAAKVRDASAKVEKEANKRT